MPEEIQKPQVKVTVTGEPYDAKVSRTVRRGAEGKGAKATSPAAYPTSEAVKHLAASIILAHNHPSSQVEPSKDDIELTRRLVKAGEIMGVEIIDHLIISPNDFLSLKERGLM